MLKRAQNLMVVLLVAGLAFACQNANNDIREAARQSAETAAQTPNPQAPNVQNPQAPAVPTGPTTTMTFEETTFDFGTINEGEKVRHTYAFTNTGSEPLILSDAKGSCGCTVPQWPREPIAAGESGEIIVEFNSKNKSGKKNQKVTITANTNPPQTFIYLTGTVNKTDGATTAQPSIQVN